MEVERVSIGATVKSASPWLALLALVVGAGLALGDEPARRAALRAVLALTAAAEGAAGLAYVFRARRMAERAGRPYAASYHGVMQDFGFYNLAIALLLAGCAVDPGRNVAGLRAAIALYALHGTAHLLRYAGCYFGGETRIPTRARVLELRDALQLIAALAGTLAFYPTPSG